MCLGLPTTYLKLKMWDVIGLLLASGQRELTQDHSGRKPATEGGTFCETETRNAICLAFLNACDSAVAPLDDLAQLAELDLNAQRRDR